jgi:hypothetical protein
LEGIKAPSQFEVKEKNENYEGKMENGFKSGFGKFINSMGDVYEGDWKDDQFHGKGKETYWDNSGGRI